MFLTERPEAEIILLTGWGEVLSTDSLVLQCKVEESGYKWNYTWYVCTYISKKGFKGQM